MAAFPYIVMFALVAQVGETGSLRSNSATNAALVPAAEQPKRSDPPLIEKMVDRVSTLGESLARLPQLGVVEEEVAAKPPTLIWVRMSSGYLADHVERSVDRKKPVRDLILGTTIVGESRTVGETRLVLYPNDEQAWGEVVFEGEVHARTTGRNGLARLRYLSDSTFKATKRLVIDEAGLKALPAVAEAPTRLTPTQITTTLPGLRGRFARRIARRRVAESRARADAIASDHTADDVRHDLDRKLNAAVKEIQKVVQPHIAKLKKDNQDKRLVLRSRSTKDHIEFALCRHDAENDALPMAPIPLEANPEIAIRAHRTVLVQAIGDAELRERIAPLLSGTIVSPPTVATINADDTRPEVTLDGEWLTIDWSRPEQGDSAPRVAFEHQPPTRK